MSRTFFSLRRRRGFSPRHPAPVAIIEDAGLVSGLGVGSALFHLSSCIFISSVDATQFLKPAKPCGCTVSTMDLSEARGLDHRRWKGLFTRDAQAACDFSFSTSKFSPFFQRVSVMAAILRASVRRTIVGLMPLASDLW